MHCIYSKDLPTSTPVDVPVHHAIYTGTYSNMDMLREITFHPLCCVKSTRKVSRELKYFINDSLEELSTDGFFDLEDSQCLEMMSSKCISTFKSMYQVVYGRKFK